MGKIKHLTAFGSRGRRRGCRGYSPGHDAWMVGFRARLLGGDLCVTKVRR
jgi:hypothetical protein